MNGWIKLENKHFDNFNIEDLKHNFFIPYNLIEDFKRYIENNTSNTQEDKLNNLNSLVNSPISDIDFLSTTVNSNFNSIININNFTGIKTDKSSGDNQLLTGVDKEGILDILKANYGSINDVEYVLAYYQTNIFGSFNGTIVTNKRIGGIGKQGFVIPINEVKSVESKLFGARYINNNFRIYGSDAMLDLLKRLINVKFIPFALLIKFEGGLFSSTKGTLFFSREL